MAQPTVSRWARGALAVKTEATYGIDAAPGAADIVYARNITFAVSQGQFRNDSVGGLMAQLPSIPGARFAMLSAEILLRGAAAVYSASVKPPVDPLLRASGLLATGAFGVGTEKWTYTPQSGDIMGEAASIQFVVENAPTGKFLGCFGTGRITKRAGEPGVMAIGLQGLYLEPALVTMISAAPSSIQVPQFKSAAVLLDAVSFAVSEAALDLGGDVQVVPVANDAQAIGKIILGQPHPMATFDPEAVAPATYNFHLKRDTGAVVAASWQLGTVQYNRVKFSAPKLQYLDIAEIQRNGLRAYRLACQLNASVGGDEYSIVFD
jgi:hypothetical protein